MLERTENAQARSPHQDDCQRILKVAFDLHNSGRHPDAEALCRLLLPHLSHDTQLLLLFGHGRAKGWSKWGGFNLPGAGRPTKAKVRHDSKASSGAGRMALFEIPQV